ncbi:MAG: holo-ACP synthase [Elusimicrobia bacterium]|nr:holo-ACP synthase [Elusimicrobiota bacterium]
MKTSGLGIDIVETRRIKKASSKKFLIKVYSKKELDSCLKSANKYERLAARFAAKEAVIKALNKKNIPLNKIEILNELSGKPTVKIRGEKKKLLISISHCKDYACAVCLAF